ncbi:MAG: hypothetical protein R2748_16850 [Bryobacterales bacterium]
MPTLKPPLDERESRHWDGLPPQTVFAVFEDELRARLAEERLLCLGIPHSNLHVLSGEEGANVLLPDSPNEGPDFLSKALGALTDQTTFLEEYAKELRLGRALIAARFETAEDRGEIEALLLDSGGQHVTYTSGWTITVVGSGHRA